MKITALSLVLGLALAGTAMAQVKVEVLMDNDQFLPGEPIPVKTRVINNSGQTLRFGKEEWINYSVESTGGFIVVKTGTVPSAHDFDIRAAEWAAYRADLAPYFNITKPGRYAITATVSIADWNNSVSSGPKYFDVVAGTKVWEQAFGVPQQTNDHSAPEVRKYILQQATFAKRMKMYLLITDQAESRTYRVIPIGPMISFSDPQTLVDRTSFLHLLYQENAHIYSYTVTNPEGELVLRQTYQYVNSAPHLRVNDTGKPIIVGGVRHFAANDVPPAPRPTLTNDIPLSVR